VLLCSLDRRPELFPSLIYHLLTVVCLKSAETSISCCFSWANSCWASYTHASACSSKSSRLIDGVKAWSVRRSQFRWNKGMCFLTQQFQCWTLCAQPVCCPATVLQFLWKLHRWFSTFIKDFSYPQSVGKWTAILCAKNDWRWSVSVTLL